MIAGDYTSVYNKIEKCNERHVVSIKGKKYIIGKKMGSGAVAKVFHASEVGGQQNLVFKEYRPSPELRLVHGAIKGNIIKLIQNPIRDAKGNYLPHFVRPLDIVDLPASGGFGYIMEKVDVNEYLSLPQLWHKDVYPDARIICHFGKEFAKFFTTLHLKGWCYKDLNEGNIFIHPRTGDFYVVDCDNISVPNVKTILGTTGYMAPEIYSTRTPDTQSDYFSIAVVFFRLLVGGYPMDGPRTELYMKRSDLDVGSAAAVIYGKDAVFGFHPSNKDNAVYLSGEKKHITQTRTWNSLPRQIKKCFLQTFATALPPEKRNLRTNDVQWFKVFDDLEKNHLVECPKCKKSSFDNRKTCSFCGDTLPIRERKEQKKVEEPKYEVVFESLSVINGQKIQKKFGAELEQMIHGKDLHPDFAEKPYFYTRLRPDIGKYTIVNCSGLSWEVAFNDKTKVVPEGGEVQLTRGMVVKVDKTKFIMRVQDVQKK